MEQISKGYKMRVPYKPIYLPKSYKKFNYIIIHDYTCQFLKFDKARTDSKKVTVNDIRSYFWIFDDQFDLPYHFVCKQFGDDFETIMSRPLAYYCEYLDLSGQYLNSIHIAIAGKYDFITPEILRNVPPAGGVLDKIIKIFGKSIKDGKITIIMEYASGKTINIYIFLFYFLL